MVALITHRSVPYEMTTFTRLPSLEVTTRETMDLKLQIPVCSCAGHVYDDLDPFPDSPPFWPAESFLAVLSLSAFSLAALAPAS